MRKEKKEQRTVSKEKNVQFRQSLGDFPLTVRLGEKIPSWGLSRWRGNSGLRFMPNDDEGFSLRGDKRRLVYKGRRRSHRFTILGDGAFEYDCILNREPDSNVVSLAIDGTEGFNFFRQPDFVPDPFLKGSYAVYKKDTFIGEGTGKLCHIHRPELIDARGRRCWGELAIVGNELQITIPEKWLSEASYPVVVDPTIGTTTIGSQFPTVGQPSIHAGLTYEYGVNRFLVPENIAGSCTAYIYLFSDAASMGEIRPVLFDDINSKPLTRRSKNEEWMRGKLWDYGPDREWVWEPPHWRTTQFEINGTVQAGSYIWFGGQDYGGFQTKFDYGGIFYKNYDDYN